jgi:hypothetical protein
MDGVRSGPERVIGGIMILLGILAIREGARLHALRTEMVAGAVVGDDTFPLIVGVALLLLGGAVAVVRLPSAGGAMPGGVVRARMLWGLALLVSYWLVLPAIGYTGSTAIVSVALFRAMGGYRWPSALLLGGATTALLYLLFRVWLLQPLPAGWLGV